MEDNQYQSNQYNGQGGKPPKKPMGPGVVVVCLICGTIMFLGFWGMLFGQFFKNLFTMGDNQTYAKEGLGNTLDVIKVEGTIAEGQTDYQHSWTLDTIDDLMDSSTNKGILLYVNSPGGGIYESDELYSKLKEYKEETGRPVYAYMAQEAASGGLYVSMAADKIYANRMTMTGSIGVIMSVTDTTGLQKLIGVKEDKVVSGKNKAMGNPLTDEQRAILQSMVNESYDIFVDIVAENRHLDKKAVYKMADGRVYSAKQAKDLGIVDEIGSYEETIKAMQSAEGLTDCAVYVQTPPVSVLNSILYGAKNSIQPESAELNKITKYIESSKTPKLMYYMQ